MIGITFTTDQIRDAPAEVRQWIEHQVIASLGLAADALAAAEHPHGAHLIACNTEDAAAVLAQIKGLFANWRWVRYPEGLSYKHSEGPGELFVHCIDTEMKEETLEARRTGKTFDPAITVYDQWEQ